MDEYSLDYYYGLEAEEFSFIRVPKLLITLPIYKCLTSDDKLLYGILLDRMGLSVKNRWIDGEGRVYIIFTIGDVMNSLNCAASSCNVTVSPLSSYCVCVLTWFPRRTCSGTFAKRPVSLLTRSSRSARFTLPIVTV